jgi:hypothetical protein
MHVSCRVVCAVRVLWCVLSKELKVSDRDVGVLVIISAIAADDDDAVSSSMVESDGSELLRLGCDRLRFPSMPLPPPPPPPLNCICNRCERDRACDSVDRKCDRLRPVFRALDAK